jgi:hypothetical protein
VAMRGGEAMVGGRRRWWLRKTLFVDHAQIERRRLPTLDLGVEHSVPFVPGAIPSA